MARNRPPPDLVALHVGRVMYEAMGIVAATVRQDEGPLSADEVFARRRISLIAAATPIAIPDAVALAVVLRRLVEIGFHRARIMKSAKNQRAAHGHARAVKARLEARRAELREGYAKIQAKNPRIGEEEMAARLGVTRKVLRGALGKTR